MRSIKQKLCNFAHRQWNAEYLPWKLHVYPPTEFCVGQSKVFDMKFVDSASIDDNTYGDGTKPPSTWLTPDVLPEAPAPHQAENSQTGAFSNSSHKSSAHKTIK